MPNEERKIHIVIHHFADQELRPHEEEVADLAWEFDVEPDEIDLTYEVMPGSVPPDVDPPPIAEASLTVFERTVMRRLLAREGFRDIARALGTEPQVVRRAFRSIFTKLHVYSTSEAIERYGSELEDPEPTV
jgi:DNA-binding CsgD family transcriptional regulator